MGLSLTGVTALWSLSKTMYPSLVLVKPRKTRPCLTERLLMGHKESNQTNKQTKENLTGNESCQSENLTQHTNKIHRRLYNSLASNEGIEGREYYA